MGADIHNPTQGTRRTKYGLSVIIAIVAAAGIVVAINFIVDRAFRRLAAHSPGAIRLVRFDLTATRRYSLSPQTLKVLRGLEGDYEIVTMFRDTNIHVERVRDLVEEYGAYSDKLQIEQLNPAQPVQTDRFYHSLLSRFEKDLAPLQTAIQVGQAALLNVTRDIATSNMKLKAAIEAPDLTNQATKQDLSQVMVAFQRLESDSTTIGSEFDTALEQPLPSYDAIRSDIANYLSQIEGKLLGAAIERFEHALKVDDTPNGVQNKLLEVIEVLKAARQRTQDALSNIQFADPIDAYEQVRSTLISQESIAILSPNQVRVIPIQEMFRELPPEMAGESGQRELGFIGEERLTGVLVSMSLVHPPMVVFIQTDSSRPAIGPRGGQCEFVAQRLRSASIRVEQWNPAGRQSQFGQQTPPSPPPEAEAGQKIVWIVLPFPPPNPSNPMSFMASGAKQKVADHLKDRLAAGDGAMLILSVEPAMGFGEGNPLLNLLEDWGIEAQIDRLVMRQVQLPDRKIANMIRFDITQWPTGSPITAALSGMPAMFVQTSPIVIKEDTKQPTTHTPLVVLHGKRLWANNNLTSPDQIQSAPMDETQRSDRFDVAVAAEQGNQRLIVVTDPIWAMDQVTTLGPLGPGTANLLGAIYPGNAELFVNSVYWLGQLDELIAASPRSQDIRRIASMSDAERTGWKIFLLVGMPAMVLLVGMGVWFTRRKG